MSQVRFIAFGSTQRNETRRDETKSANGKWSSSMDRAAKKR